MGYLDISKIKVCKILEDNYNIILNEYNNFAFDIAKDLEDDENWNLWKSTQRTTYNLSKGDGEDDTSIPYKESHSWYGLLMNDKSVWDGALLAIKSKKGLNSTPIGNNFFNETFKCIKEYPEVLSAMIARLPSGGSLPKHRGYRQINRIHLGLIVPEGDIRFCVSDIEKKWEIGKCLAFNDHSEHTAWNNTNKDRINLIVDVNARL